MKQKNQWVLVGGMVAFAAIWLASRVPSDAGPWAPAQARKPVVQIKGREIVVHNLRDFRYTPDGKPLAENYLREEYHLDNLVGGWFGLSHFGPAGLAHSFMSFEFERAGQKRYLVLSIEARRGPGEPYLPLRGMFRQYTKINVLSTEQDVIGVRSHISGERVLLYPLRSETAAAEAYLLTMLKETNALYERPAFYNTILDNCLTNLLEHAAIREQISRINIKVLLPGRVDHLTYAFGITPADMPFDEARAKATVDPGLVTIDDPEFSAALRCGWTDSCANYRGL